jgi:hypothetical protein
VHLCGDSKNFVAIPITANAQAEHSAVKPHSMQNSTAPDSVAIPPEQTIEVIPGKSALNLRLVLRAGGRVRACLFVIQKMSPPALESVQHDVALITFGAPQKNASRPPRDAKL